MANLYTGEIDTEGQYKSLASETGVTFTADTKYTIQIQNSAWIREGETGEGFYINDSTPFTYTAGADDLYIKTESYSIVNIAE